MNNFAAHLSRRQFAQSLVSLGVLGTLPLSLVACTKEELDVTWHSEADEGTTFDDLIGAFNKDSKEFQIKRISGVNATSLDALKKRLRNKQDILDILAVDVVWMKELVDQGHLIPLDDLISKDLKDLQVQILKQALSAVTIKKQGEEKEHIWGIPLHTDVGIFFYRKDIFDTAPKDWDEVRAVCQEAVKRPDISYGYLWQGAALEGLVCNYTEVLSSFDGQFFDKDVTPTKSTLLETGGVEALAMMYDWIYSDKISPRDVTTYTELESSNIWRQGLAACMRNWPGHITWTEDKERTQIAERYAIATLPPRRLTSGSFQRMQSCLGGWQLAINADSKHKDLAWKFIRWMISEEHQRYLAFKEAFPVALGSVYADEKILKEHPGYDKLKDIVATSVARPRISFYDEFSSTVRRHINKALSTSVSANQKDAMLYNTIVSLQNELNVIIEKAHNVK